MKIKNLIKFIYFFSILLLFLFFSSKNIQAATSISQNNITWNFNEDYTTGQFVNGDYYVVAPAGLTINTILPASVSATRDINGCMINPSHPGGANGFDEAISWDPPQYAPYNESLNVALNISAGSPLVVSPGSSLVCVKSQDAAEALPAFTDMAILTVLNSLPPENSFRPGYMGTDKIIPHTVADVNWGALETLNPLSGAPSFNTLEDITDAVWYEGMIHWVGRYFRATNNVPISNYGYGSDMATYSNQALLLLNCDYSNATKEKLLYQMLQYSIDIANCNDNGIAWWANGGHGHGRKSVLAFGAIVFDDDEMKTKFNYENYPQFAEDLHIWPMTESWYSTTVIGHGAETNGVLQYTSIGQPVGTPEWSFDPVGTPLYANASQRAVYRDDWGSNIGGLLAIEIMNGKNLWNRQLTFDYAKRFMEMASEGTVGAWGTYTPGVWVTSMWNTYEDQYSGSDIIPPAEPTNLSVL